MDTIKKLYLDFILSFSKTRFYLILFLGLILSIITIIEPLFLSEIIKQVEEFLKTGNFSQNAFFYVVISWIIFETFYLSYFFYYRFYIADVHALKNHNKVFSRKIGKIIRMSYGAYLRKKSGSIYKNFDRGTGAQFDSVFFFFNDFIINIFQVVILIIFLLFIDVRMTLISLSLVPVMAFVGIYFNKKTNLKQMELNKTYDKIFGGIGDFFNNFVLSKTLNLEKIFEKEEKNLIDETYKKQYSISKSWAIVSIYTNVIVGISRFLLIGFGAYFVINGSLEFYKLFLFYAYINYVYFPLSFLFSSFGRIQKIVSSAESFYREFDDLETENLEIGENLENISGNIEFRNVNFGYLEEKKILKDLSFSIKKGETVAFVGNTGAGKSTILNLILKLWKINSGEIIVDGKNLENISKKSLRMHIGVVNQDIGLYNDTLRQNMLYANPKASEKEIFEALEKAEANFVKKLENGIDTIIGERGLKLSGGEKQRIAIARLFLKNPKILILDEATSALDNKTEKLVQKALEKLMKGKTSIVIAHRLSTIQNADKIFFLENGEIKESGTYEELIVKNGKFAELANPKNLIIN
ncbi:ABC transporter ATP-binding protein [Candidatus Gracilibacteria bacterium]|nr:MAG: ABC transporter ATP-binding protein [Candidatus Gracilibacteria bacterium]